MKTAVCVSPVIVINQPILVKIHKIVEETFDVRIGDELSVLKDQQLTDGQYCQNDFNSFRFFFSEKFGNFLNENRP